MRSRPHTRSGLISSSMDIEERFLAAIAYIEARLAEPLRLAEVASYAGWSPPYFSRLFRSLTGEPFGSYVRRRRLTRAAQRLRAGGASPRLIDLALECRYDSQEAFTRAFKRAFGSTPGAFRKRPAIEGARFRPAFDAATFTHLRKNLRTKPEIREIDAFHVAGLCRRFDSQSKHEISKLWNDLSERIPRISYRTREEAYGVTSNLAVDAGSFDYLAGVAVRRIEGLPEDVVAESLPRQTYAVFSHRRHSSSLHHELKETLRWIWGVWLPSSEYDYVPAPDLERYAKGSTARVDICIPVRLKA